MSNLLLHSGIKPGIVIDMGHKFAITGGARSHWLELSFFFFQTRILAHAVLLSIACGRFAFGRAHAGARPLLGRVCVSIA